MQVNVGFGGFISVLNHMIGPDLHVCDLSTVPVILAITVLHFLQIVFVFVVLHVRRGDTFSVLHCKK